MSPVDERTPNTTVYTVSVEFLAKLDQLIIGTGRMHVPGPLMCCGARAGNLSGLAKLACMIRTTAGSTRHTKPTVPGSIDVRTRRGPAPRGTTPSMDRVCGACLITLSLESLCMWSRGRKSLSAMPKNRTKKAVNRYNNRNHIKQMELL